MQKNEENDNQIQPENHSEKHSVFSSISKFFFDVRFLLWKNFLIFKRNYVSTLFPIEVIR